MMKEVSILIEDLRFDTVGRGSPLETFLTRWFTIADGPLVSPTSS